MKPLLGECLKIGGITELYTPPSCFWMEGCCSVETELNSLEMESPWEEFTTLLAAGILSPIKGR